MDFIIITINSNNVKTSSTCLVQNQFFLSFLCALGDELNVLYRILTFSGLLYTFIFKSQTYIFSTFKHFYKCIFVMMLVSHYSACKISFTMLPNNSSADSRLICQGEAPCSPFWCHIRALRPFSAPYMRPSALFDASYAPSSPSRPSLYAPNGPFCLRLCVHLCVCVSVSRLKGF